MSGQQIGIVNPNYGTLGVPSPSNTHGWRWAYTHWKDKQGNFWLHGGSIAIIYSDMWMYNPVTNTWTWMAGTSAAMMGETFTQTCSPSGLPSSAWENRTYWTDDCGRFGSFEGYNKTYTGQNTS
jgi:hypothetical protein